MSASRFGVSACFERIEPAAIDADHQHLLLAGWFDFGRFFGQGAET